MASFLHIALVAIRNLRMLTLWPSMRHALQRPFASLSVIALVAVAVLANTTLFSALWTLGGKPLPYRQAARLVELRIHLTDIDYRASLAPRLLQALSAEPSVFAGQIGFPGARTARDADGRTCLLYTSDAAAHQRGFR